MIRESIRPESLQDQNLFKAAELQAGGGPVRLAGIAMDPLRPERGRERKRNWSLSADQAMFDHVFIHVILPLLGLGLESRRSS